MPRIRPFLRNGIMKTWPEYRALTLKRVPGFVFSDRVTEISDGIPVFVFHSLEENEFETQLQHLSRNGYRTIDADELVQVLRGERTMKSKSVLLTFDDGRASQWVIGAPLLQRYGHRAMVFAIPRLIPEGDPRPTLGERSVLRETGAGISGSNPKTNPLATWSELSEMADSGVGDIQCHTWNHDRVFVSSKIVDFVNPEFDFWDFGNIHLPVYWEDGIENLDRHASLGMPVYQSLPRMRAATRYLADEGLRKSCASYVRQHGGTRFFTKKYWERELRGHVSEYSKSTGDIGRYAEPEAVEQGMARDLERAKHVLEGRLGVAVKHLCYPWFEGSAPSTMISRKLGYESNFWGDLPGRRTNRVGHDPFRIVRIPGSYIMRLPGEGRMPLERILSRQLGRNGSSLMNRVPNRQ